MRAAVATCLLLASCSRPTPPTAVADAGAHVLPSAFASAAASALPASVECSLATPLAPGVPGSPGNLLASPRNPNGVSELAALMRAMLADLERARPLAAAGKGSPALWSTHRKMRCAWPTDPADRNAAFDGHAQHYLARVRELDERPSAAAYDDVIGACRSCHETTCSGVLGAIDGLKR